MGAYGEFSMQGYEVAASGHELYSLQTRMELLGIPSKHQQQQQHHPNPDEGSWRSGHLYPRQGCCSSPASESGLMVSADGAGWDQPRQLFVDDASMRCLFPVHDEEQQPSQGLLSLSLYNPEPSIADAADFHRSLMFSRPTSTTTTVSHHQQGLFPGHAGGSSVSSHKLKLTKYLVPAQELLNEFCDLGGVKAASKQQKQQGKRVEEGGPSSASSVINHSLQHLDILELQKRKAKLLTLLEEVDRRYKRYCEQMRAVVSSFEAVAGEGAATAYLALASKAMSRHFRSLRDGIVGQIQAAKKAMGEKDPIAPGISRGETPRLKVLDQCLRQQKAFQQGGMLMDHHPWRPQRGLPERSVSILRAWLFEHFLHPYPSDVDKHILARQTGLSRSQVSNWFINARVRLWKPMIEEMYTEEIKEHENQPAGGQQDDRNPNPSCSREAAAAAAEEHKPLPAELLTEPDSLSSIINHHSESRTHRTNQMRDQLQLHRAENFGMADLDFSSYEGCSSQSYSTGNGVSLTLGLQHHNSGAGMAFSVSPTNPQPLFYPRGQIEECQPVQFSIIDGEVQNLPYRNLMGAQLLHDLAG